MKNKLSNYGGVIAVVLGLIAVVVWVASLIFKGNRKSRFQWAFFTTERSEDVLTVKDFDRIKRFLSKGGKAILCLDSVLSVNNDFSCCAKNDWGDIGWDDIDSEVEEDTIFPILCRKGFTKNEENLSGEQFLREAFGDISRQDAIVAMLSILAEGKGHLSFVVYYRIAPNVILAVLKELYVSRGGENWNEIKQRIILSKYVLEDGMPTRSDSKLFGLKEMIPHEEGGIFENRIIYIASWRDDIWLDSARIQVIKYGEDVLGFHNSLLTGFSMEEPLSVSSLETFMAESEKAVSSSHIKRWGKGIVSSIGLTSSTVEDNGEPRPTVLS